MARATEGEAFLFYFERWRGSRPVQRMTFAERGIFLEMLIEQWMRGDLPDDPQAMADAIATSDAQVGDVHAAWPALRRQFTQVDGALSPRIYNERLEQIRQQRMRWQRKQRKAAVDGGRARWGGGDPKGRTRHQRIKEARERGTHTEDEWNDMRTTYQRCLRCGVSESALIGKRLTKDHIVPLYQDGDDSIQNLQPVCRACNTAKGSTTTDYRVGLPETKPEWLPQKHRNSVAADGSDAAAMVMPSREELSRGELRRTETREIPRAHTRTVFDGSLPRDHRDHVFCDPSFTVCVPSAVHAKFIGPMSRKFDGDRQQAHAALLLWYATVAQQLPAEFVMGDAFRFWQARFDGDLATPQPQQAAGKQTTRLASALINIKREAQR